MFNPVSNSWVHAFVCVGEETGVFSDFIKISDTAYNYANYPYTTTASLTNQGGVGWHYAIKDGTYGKTSVFSSYNGGVCLHKKDSRFGLTCSHANRTVGSPYLERERTFSLPDGHFDYDEEIIKYEYKNIESFERRFLHRNKVNRISAILTG